MVRTLGGIEGLREISANPQMRPLTKYEQRGQRLGHQVWDFAFVKCLS